MVPMSCGPICSSGRRHRKCCHLPWGPDCPSSEATGRASRPAWDPATRINPIRSKIEEAGWFAASMIGEAECRIAGAPPTCGDRAIPQLYAFKSPGRPLHFSDRSRLFEAFRPDHNDIHRISDISHGVADLHTPVESALHYRFDDQQVDVAVLVHLPRSRRTKQNDLVRTRHREYPAHDLIQQCFIDAHTSP